MDLAAALRTSGQDYEVLLDLSADSKEELIWWDTHMIKWNGKTMLLVEPDMVIESDAVEPGMGCALPGHRYGRSLGLTRDELAHKLPGIAGSNTSAAGRRSRRTRHACQCYSK